MLSVDKSLILIKLGRKQSNNSTSLIEIFSLKAARFVSINNSNVHSLTPSIISKLPMFAGAIMSKPLEGTEETEARDEVLDPLCCGCSQNLEAVFSKFTS